MEQTRFVCGLHTKHVYAAILGTLAISSVLVINTRSGDKFLKWSLRKIVIQFSGLIDFYEYHNSKCFIYNPLEVIGQDSNQCDICEDFNDVKYYFDNGHLNLTETNFNLQMKYPFVVRRTGSEDQGTSVYSMVEEYVSNKRLSIFHPCQFESNWKSKAVDHWTLMNMIHKHEASSFYLVWENCAEQSLKEFRQFYYRPNFLEPNVQLTGSNWALLCSDFDGKRYRDVELMAPLAVFIVKKGIVKVNLAPHDDCSEMCSAFSMTLKSTDVLVFSSSLYTLSVLPKCRNKELIAVGFGGQAD